MKQTRSGTHRKSKAPVIPGAVKIILALVVLLCAAMLILGRGTLRAAEPTPDPHAGMVEVFNGASYVWVVPQEGVPVNRLAEDDFAMDEQLGPVYTGTQYDTKRGIDVSVYQGNIDWQAVADSGIDFAVIRAGGTFYVSGDVYADDYFEQNLSGAQTAGLDAGVYFFSQAITPEEAREEARYVLDMLAGRELQLPVFFDWERIANDPDARTNELDGTTLTDCAIAFCQEIENAGYEAGVYIYSDTGYYGYELARLQDYMLWSAAPGENPYFYYAHSLWQYSFTGEVPGIEGNCDMNMLFIERQT